MWVRQPRRPNHWNSTIGRSGLRLLTEAHSLVPEQALPAGLEDLGLALNEVTPAGAAALAPALRAMRGLRRLSLRENELENEGGITIAQALAGSAALEALDFSQNQVCLELASASTLHALMQSASSVGCVKQMPITICVPGL